MRIVLALFLMLISLQNAFAGEWNALTPGDKIDVLWTSGPNRGNINDLEEKLEETVQPLTIDLHKSNIDPSQSLGGYYANSDKTRGEAFYTALMDPHTKAIWFGRGGFGDNKVVLWLFKLMKERETARPERPIPLIGFSDLTVSHMLAHNWGWPSLHAPMANFSKETVAISGVRDVGSESSVTELIDILTGKITEVSYELQILNPDIANSEKYPTSIDTKVIGGNLSVLLRNNGIPGIQLDHAKLVGSILFLEDTEEAFNRASDLLASLAGAGLFNQVTAIFFGNYPMTGRPFEEVIAHFDRETLRNLLGLYIPILYSPNFGHGLKNDVLPLGTQSSLVFNSDTTTATLRCSTNQSGY